MAKKLTEFDYHEAMDRLFLSMDNFESNIVDHQAIERNKEWSKRAQQIQQDMYDLYQDVATKRFDLVPPKKTAKARK